MRGSRQLQRTVPMLALLAAWAVSPLQAQELQQIARAIQRNQAALREFAWTASTELVVGARIRLVETQRIRFGPDGATTKTPIGPADESARGRRPGRALRSHARLRDELDRLLESYTQLTPERAEALASRGQVWREAERGDGTVSVRARGVVHGSDSLEIRVETATWRPTRLEVLTSLRGEPVHLTVDYAPVEDGPSFPVRTIVETEAGEKKMVIRTENSEFSRIEGGGR